MRRPYACSWLRRLGAVPVAHLGTVCNTGFFLKSNGCPASNASCGALPKGQRVGPFDFRNQTLVQYFIHECKLKIPAKLQHSITTGFTQFRLRCPVYHFRTTQPSGN